MFSLQFLSMRNVYDPEMIPKKCDYHRCCKIIHHEEAIRNGQLECLKYIHIQDENIEIFKSEYCMMASKYGQLECLKFFT